MDPYKYFSERLPGEEVVLLVRRHWQVMIRQFILFITESFIPIIIFIVTTRFTNFTFQKDTPSGVLIVLSACIYYLYIWLFFFYHWLDYYLDVWVVTNERILNIEQHGLFSRTISEISIQNVQDVTSELKGKSATILNYGDVHIQSAAEEERFIFEQIPHPQEVANKIMELHHKSSQSTSQVTSKNIPTPPQNKEEKDNPKDQKQNYLK